MQSFSYEKRMHGSYFVVILVAVVIVAVVFGGLFFFQVFKPVLTSADSGESLGRNSESKNTSVSLLPHNWLSEDDIDTTPHEPPTIRLSTGESASTAAVTQFFVNHPGASIKLCVHGKAASRNGSLRISSPSLSGATIALSDIAFRTVCLKQTVSSSVGTSESPEGWNVLQIHANSSTILVRSVSLASASL